ncbi:putative N-acetylglucosamine-6-phosphate deacetylase [Candidatus Protochlamydia naegleriophila]|uniref:Putative N-acetylglucosamine-6-phosphate deacetylase n=1 Tax=Candidatus Protochlamydia naegleriophila TaxID=389348 RepID=A0A0U5JAK8_9BACT|nr:putative N-acetylglucosamine-6-phosphate deacetylase [Candidatus Protochlamydia naegleriophila]
MLIAINVKRLIIASGYIDLQINEGFGIDFSVQADQVKHVASQLPKYGVTAFLPTLVSLNKELYKHLLPHYSRILVGPHGSTILGIHLEGLLCT